ncbi:MAG TPA: aldehyde reductase [Caulobacteraceae bacterium]|jgi:nucleoside-diphosphate-sugar epimerase|nr:aldehyde reductase [Caulobacteraceae bacterium]
MADKGVALVTGGSGYIGGWCVIALLQQGYTVRATIRDLARAEEVKRSIETIVDPEGRLTFHAADLTSDAGWDKAAEGVDFVLHVASPLGVPEPKDPNDLINPARDGALRAIRAAIKAGAKRVVMTSSVAATSRPLSEPDSEADETVWTDGDDVSAGAYARSKTIAEKAAWELVRNQGNGTSLAVVNPALVLGPVFGPDYSDSVQIVERLLKGRIPGLPHLGFCVVDVRDVADLHLRAMTAPEAGGERFIAAGEFAWMAEIASMLRARLPERVSKIPTAKAPDLMIRLAALVDHDLKTVTPSLGHKRVFSSAKAERVLGWKPRPIEETLFDCARSLIDRGLA